VGVTNVAVHLAVAIWDTSVTEEDQELVSRLGILRRVVPEVGGVVHVCQMCRWVAFLCVDLEGLAMVRELETHYSRSEETWLGPLGRRQACCWRQHPSCPLRS
jgi:hypothetical protein